MDETKIYKQKHEFALYIESLSILLQEKSFDSSVIFTDEKLFHRVVNVLRLRVGQECIFFDQKMYITAQIKAFVGKKQIHITVQATQQTVSLYPTVTFLLPVLKRDDLESALYVLTEMGVNTIQLVFTHKSVNQWSFDRDRERVQRIIIAAAEQSKNFAYPYVKEPIPLDLALKQYKDVSTKIFFDPQGEEMFTVMQSVYSAQPEHILLLVGPEGDLKIEEKEMIQINNFIFCALTPTVIRAAQAASLAAGLVRSLLVSKLY